MGYRSEVAIVIRNKDFSALVAKSKSECEEAYYLLKNEVIRQNDKHTTLHFDYVKWYQDDTDVQFIENFIDDISHIFKRIGEDHDDIEERSNDADYEMYECVSFVRSLNTDCAGEEIKIE